MELRPHLPALKRRIALAATLAAVWLSSATASRLAAAESPSPVALPAGTPPPALPAASTNSPVAATQTLSNAPASSPSPDVLAPTAPAPASASAPAAAPLAVPVPAAAAVPSASTNAPPARTAGQPQGTIRTSAGRTLTGGVSFNAEGLAVVLPGADAVQVPLAELVELTFPDAPSSASDGGSQRQGTDAATAIRPADKPSSPTTPAPAPGGWAVSTLGSAPQGQSAPAGDGWSVTGGGSGLRANADAAVFVERRLDVAGQVSVLLRAFNGQHPEAVAGLMLRDNLGDAAAYAFLGQRGGSGLCFQYRQIASGMTMRFTNVSLPLPVWLRLERVGGSVAGAVSTDGREWNALGRVNVNLGQNIRVGTVVASGTDDTTATAAFGLPALGSTGFGYVPAAGYPRIVLRGGSVLVAPVESADESVVRLGGAWRGALVSVLNLARIEFLPLPAELVASLEPERPGVLLTDGDFLDASLRAISTNTVTMNSLLFGFRKFAIGSEAGVVQTGTVEPEDAAFRLRLQDGSVLLARQLTLGTNQIRAESPLLGSLSVPVDQIRTLRRAGQER